MQLVHYYSEASIYDLKQIARSDNNGQTKNVASVKELNSANLTEPKTKKFDKVFTELLAMYPPFFSMSLSNRFI